MKANLNKLLPFLGLRGKLLIAFMGLALLPFVTFATCNIRATNEALAEANAEHLRLELRSNIGHLKSYLRLLEVTAQIIAREVQDSGVFDGESISQDARAKTEQLFYQVAEMRPDLFQIRLIDEDGLERVKISREGGRVNVAPAHALQNKAHRYYFTEAMATPAAETFISPLDLNVENGRVETPHRLVFRLARGVVDWKGSKRGLVIINVFASELLDRVTALRPGPQGDVLLVENDGRFVRQRLVDGARTYTFGHIGELLTSMGSPLVSEVINGQTRVMAEDQDQFVSFAPVHTGMPGHDPRWSLAIIYPRDQVLQPVTRMRRRAYFFAAVVALLALVLGVLATRALTTPIEKILGFVRGVAQADFRRRLEIETRDEIEELAAGVKSMAAALDDAQGRLVRYNEELQREVRSKVAEIESLLETKHSMTHQLRQADRLASLGMLSASLAHEIGNPLAAMKTVIQVHLRGEDVPESSREALEIVLSEVDRLAEILERTTSYVRPAQVHTVEVTLEEVFARIAFLVDSAARKKGVKLELKGRDVDLPLLVEQQKLEQVLLNLLVNALQAMDEPGQVTVEVSVDDLLAITVTDTGPGIAEELRRHVFEPFFTSKPGGTGLGLPIVRQLVGELGGVVSIECPEGGGTVVRIEIPAARVLRSSELQQVRAS